VNGRAAVWLRGTQVHHEGRSWAGGVRSDVTFVAAQGDREAGIDDADRTTYRRSWLGIAGSVLLPHAGSATIRLISGPTTW
jgi:hypothetical protein